jgi:hypothetical protein
MDNSILQHASRLSESARVKFLPARSRWEVTGIKDPSLGIDVADSVTLGAAAIAPVNVNAKVGGISVRLRNGTAREDYVAVGVGAGMSGALGWQIPFLNVSLGRSVDITEPVVATNTLDTPGGSVGTLWTGPSRKGFLAAGDFRNAYCALAKVEANFGPNGLAGGLIFFSTRPVLSATDLFHVFAFGLVASVEWALEITVEAGLMNYNLTNVDKAKAPAKA